MNSAYRRLVREWFPNARIVADRFHVIRLVNQHFSELCKEIDEKHLAHGRGGMMRILLTRRDRLTDAQKERLRTYFAARPDIESLYEFLHETADLLRVRAQNVDSCRRYVAELLNKIDQLRKHPSRRCAPWARRCIIGGKKWPECSVLLGITALQKVSIEK